MRTVRIALGIGLVGGALGMALLCLCPCATRAFPQAHMVSIREGEPLAGAARQLAGSGVVRSALAFEVYAELTGRANRVKPGDYSFAGGEGISDVLRHLVNGDFMVVTVTIPEGMTVHQIGERLQQARLVCENVFDNEAVDGAVPRALGLGRSERRAFSFRLPIVSRRWSERDQMLVAMLERFSRCLRRRSRSGCSIWG